MKYTITAHGLNENYSMDFSSYTAAEAKERLQRFVDLTMPEAITQISIGELNNVNFRINPNDLTAGINLSSMHATDTIKF